MLTRRLFLIRVAPATVVPLLPILGPADVTANCRGAGTRREVTAGREDQGDLTADELGGQRR